MESEGLVERLRAEGRRWSGFNPDRDMTRARLCDEAADLIERLQARVAELEAGVRETQPVVNAVRLFIASEYRDARCEPEGEWLAQEARQPHADLCDTEARLDALLNKETTDGK